MFLISFFSTFSKHTSLSHSSTTDVVNVLLNFSLHLMPFPTFFWGGGTRGYRSRDWHNLNASDQDFFSPLNNLKQSSISRISTGTTFFACLYIQVAYVVDKNREGQFFFAAIWCVFIKKRQKWGTLLPFPE